jgi:hypothetical protein
MSVDGVVESHWIDVRGRCVGACRIRLVNTPDYRPSWLTHLSAHHTAVITTPVRISLPMRYVWDLAINLSSAVLNQLTADTSIMLQITHWLEPRNFATMFYLTIAFSGHRLTC